MERITMERITMKRTGKTNNLHMDIECHGFNNAKAENRLRSRSFVGVIMPEVQAVPWSIVEVARQRSGRWRPSSVRMRRMIDGKLYTLSGTQQLKMVFADANIPARPHKMYDVLYDKVHKADSPYLILTVPCPIRPVPVADVTKAVREKYPLTRFEKKQVVWIPKPEHYYMQKHFETDVIDEVTGEPVVIDGVTQTVPYSGYSYWYNELQQSDSIVRRHVLGVPDTVGGESAVYKSFDKNESILSREISATGDIFCGQDQGLYAGWVFMQVMSDDTVHIFKEFAFDHEDGLITKDQIIDYIKPYIEEVLIFNRVVFVPDPAASNNTSSGLGAVALLRQAGMEVQLCKVPNQDTTGRIECLGDFISQNRVTVEPTCVRVVGGLLGGYQYKSTASGIVSDKVDKNKFSHIIEAAQYAFVNIHKMLDKRTKRRNKARKPVRRFGRQRRNAK